MGGKWLAKTISAAVKSGDVPRNGSRRRQPQGREPDRRRQSIDDQALLIGDC